MLTNTPAQIIATIQIVDDKPENLKLLSSVLVKQGYEVRTSINGTLALASAKKHPPDLILLDIMMPEMSGYEVCRQLKADERTQEIPVIFLSALAETLDRVKAFSTGGVDYITKPFQVEEVLARVETHLTIRNLQRELQRRNAQLEEKNTQLQEALDNIKTLKGFIPICANCKKVRDDDGFWEQVEVYVRDHTEAEFSHGICPDCMQELYPELYEKLDKRRKDILDVLSKLGHANLEEIAEAVSLPENNTLNRLQIMVNDGQIKCLEVDGQNFYKLP